jgi:hypothetical protein
MQGNNRITLAIVLIVVGLVSLAMQILQPQTDVGGWIVLIIGVAFVAVFAYTRRYGSLVPGGIMTGLGAGIIIAGTFTFPSDEVASGAIVLGLGLGFLSIWVIGAVARVAQHHFWPLIPGGILAVVGGALLIGDQAVAILDYWYLAVILIGFVLLWRAMVEGRTRA